MSNKKILLIALFFGLMTALTMNFYLQRLKTAATNVQNQKVVVANIKIPAKTIITGEMISFREIPTEYIHPEAVTDINNVIGYITNSDISAGEQVLNEKLIGKKENPVNLAYSVPLGTRALSVPVNEVTGVGGLLKPGDRVDVIGTIELDVPRDGVSTGNNLMRTKVTHILLENVQVLAAGRNFRTSTTKSPEAQNQNESLNNVTLAVPVEKVQALTLMQDHGKVTLALRSPVDESKYNRQPFDDSQFLKK